MIATFFAYLKELWIYYDNYEFEKKKLEILSKYLQKILKFENFENFHKMCQSLAKDCTWTPAIVTCYNTSQKCLNMMQLLRGKIFDSHLRPTGSNIVNAGSESFGHH